MRNPAATGRVRNFALPSAHRQSAGRRCRRQAAESSPDRRPGRRWPRRRLRGGAAPMHALEATGDGRAIGIGHHDRAGQRRPGHGHRGAAACRHHLQARIGEGAPSSNRRSAAMSMRRNGSLPPPSPPLAIEIQSIASSVAARPVAIRPEAGGGFGDDVAAERDAHAGLVVAALRAQRDQVAERDFDLAAAQRHRGPDACRQRRIGRLAQRRRQRQRRADQVGTQLQRGSALPRIAHWPSSGSTRRSSTPNALRDKA